MKSVGIVVWCLGLCLLPTVLYGQIDILASSTTYQSYNPLTDQNNLTQHILYKFPDARRYGNGPFPVAMWIPGTVNSYRDSLSQIFLRQMSGRGFVAATIEYSNTNPVQLCKSYTDRAKGVFEVLRPTSAVGKLCAMTRVSCGKGIVVAGISQGGAIAVLAKNYAPDVAAVWAMSISSVNDLSMTDLSSCLANAATAIPPERLTVVNGASDPAFGAQAPLEALTGISCAPNTFQCWNMGSGAGWYRVRDNQVEDGNADHCYPAVGDCAPTDLDKGWYYEAEHNWSMKPNLDWLATFGTHRNFSANGQ